MSWLTIVVIFIIILAVCTVYTLLAECVFHLLHIGTLYKGPATLRTVALTFDDGPDARYTRHILDILRQHGAVATFFVVGRRAEQEPHMVRRMVEEGHEVAVHSHVHRHAWLMDPVTTWRNIATVKRRVERLTRRQIRYYRPPWGAFNLATYVAARWLRLRPVLWSVRAIDWLPGSYADQIVQRVVSRVHPGAIVLCHDAGGAEGAPQNMVEALPRILTHLKRLGYTFVTVADLDRARVAEQENLRALFSRYPLWRRMLIGAWGLVEYVFTKWYKVADVNRIFRIAPARWHYGPRVDAASGELVLHDDAAAIDLHFQNETLVTLSGANDNRALLRGLRLAREGFHDLALLLQHDPKYQKVQVVMARTLMNRGLELLGFHVEELPQDRTHRRLERYMRFLLGIYHPEGFARLHEGRRELSLKVVWMTRDEIIRLYGESPAGKHRGGRETAASQEREVAETGEP